MKTNKKQTSPVRKEINKVKNKIENLFTTQKIKKTTLGILNYQYKKLNKRYKDNEQLGFPDNNSFEEKLRIVLFNHAIHLAMTQKGEDK